MASSFFANDRVSWKYHLTQIMDENGYNGSELYTYEYGLGMARFWNDVYVICFGAYCKMKVKLTLSSYVSTWKEFADNVLKNPEVSHELERKGMSEAREGAAIMVPKLVWISKKL
jgi:hypothetical protein